MFGKSLLQDRREKEICHCGMSGRMSSYHTMILRFLKHVFLNTFKYIVIHILVCGFSSLKETTPVFQSLFFF